MRTTLKRLMAPEIKRTIQEFRYYRQDLFEKFPKKKLDLYQQWDICMMGI